MVVSDNASTDDTCQVVQVFNDERIKYFKNETNIGAFWNFRKVLYEHAKGMYAIYLADDIKFIDSSYISKAVDKIINNHEMVIVFSNWRYMKGDRQIDVMLPLKDVSSGKQVHGERLLLMLYTALFKRELAVNIDAMSIDCLEVDV